MKTTYMITSDKFQGSIKYEYHRGLLYKLECSPDFQAASQEQLIWLLSRTRIKEEQVTRWEQIPEITFIRVWQEVTFDNFYKNYPIKAGKKKMAQNAWLKLSEHDRALAIDYIDKLTKIKKQDGTAMPYASTYLNQKYWE